MIKNVFKYDYYRMYGTYKINLIKVIMQKSLRCILALRIEGVLGIFLRQRMEMKWGVNMGIRNTPTIGAGLFLSHANGIDINTDVIIGKNCNIGKGVTLGKENRGKRLGCPNLGDNVWIGVNSTVVGAIIIGSDVLIAPNTYVNFNVPSNSIVIGNPGRIIRREDATAGYINNKI